MISPQDIERIIDAAKIEEVVADYVNLKKRGANFIGHCPFHDEKTPSFYVSPSKGICKCFGCGKGGNAVNFIMLKETLAYPDALRFLAKKFNVEITEEKPTEEQIQSQNTRESLFVVSAYAQKHFSENLYNTDEGKSVGLGYFKERGLREDIIQKFQLGYSINHRSAFTDIAIATGYKAEYLVKSGLTIEFVNERTNESTDETAEKTNPEYRYVDRFFGRVMFPIHNVSGRVIGFGGRTLKTDTKKIAKYINSPESEIYHKSDVLYGLFQSKSAIAKEKFCFVVEGYMDVIAMHQAGIENVVSSSGTSLTTGQIKQLKRFTEEVIIAYDGDSAGINASLRGVDLLLEEGMNVKVLLFPDGDDPDSYSKKVSTEELKKFIKENSQDFISYKAQILTQNSANNPIEKANAIKSIVESIALIPEAIFRSVYIKECGRIMKVEEEILINEVNKIRAKSFQERHNREKKAAENEYQSIEQAESVIEEKKQQQQNIFNAEFQEKDIVRILINFGNKIVEVDSEDEENKPIKIQTTIAEIVLHELQNDNIVFENIVYNTIYNEFIEKINNHEIPDSNYFVNHQNQSICFLAVDLMSEPYFLANWEGQSIFTTKEEDDVKKSAYNAIYSLKSRRIELMIDDIQMRLKDNVNEEEYIELIQLHQNLLKAKKEFNLMLGRVVVK